MVKFLLPFTIVFLFSSSCQRCDCSECEEKLNKLLAETIVPIDLPEKEQPQPESDDNGQITAIVLQNGNYRFEEDDTEYEFDEYAQLINERISQSSDKIKSVKIHGHKLASYEAIFNVMAFCQANNLEPIFSYAKWWSRSIVNNSVNSLLNFLFRNDQ